MKRVHHSGIYVSGRTLQGNSATKLKKNLPIALDVRLNLALGANYVLLLQM